MLGTFSFSFRSALSHHISHRRHHHPHSFMPVPEFNPDLEIAVAHWIAQDSSVCVSLDSMNSSKLIFENFMRGLDSYGIVCSRGWSVLCVLKTNE